MEVCCDRLDSVRAAFAGGAARVELCSALSEGGLTPTPGFMKLAKKLSCGKPVFALIRIRRGDFLYSEEEVEAMEEDIKALKAAGADGFVFGCLDHDGEIDVQSCQRLVSACQGLPMTFHRAFDMARDRDAAAETIASLGFTRILTSGGAKSAVDGQKSLTELVTKLKDTDLKIMPGGGLNSHNIGNLLETTGVSEFHASARVKIPSGMRYLNGECFMGSDGAGEYESMVTDAEEVARMVKVFHDVMAGRT